MPLVRPPVSDILCSGQEYHYVALHPMHTQVEFNVAHTYHGPCNDTHAMHHDITFIEWEYVCQFVVFLNRAMCHHMHG